MKSSNIDNVCMVSFEPTLEHFQEIERWLQLEKRKSRGGFYGNLDLIEKCYNKNQMAVVCIKEKPIGFAIWVCDYQQVVEIKILEIKPNYRRKGAGKLLVENILNFLKHYFAVAFVECSPCESQSFWMSFGFEEFPQGHELKYRNNKHLFLRLLPYLECDEDQKKECEEVLEMWDQDYSKAKKLEPIYIWRLNFRKGTRELLKPIIQPSFEDWRLRWRNEQQTIFDGKIKQIDFKVNNRIFTIIKELPIPPPSFIPN